MWASSFSFSLQSWCLPTPMRHTQRGHRKLAGWLAGSLAGINRGDQAVLQSHGRVEALSARVSQAPDTSAAPFRLDKRHVPSGQRRAMPSRPVGLQRRDGKKRGKRCISPARWLCGWMAFHRVPVRPSVRPAGQWSIVVLPYSYLPTLYRCVLFGIAKRTRSGLVALSPEEEAFLSLLFFVSFQTFLLVFLAEREPPRYYIGR